MKLNRNGSKKENQILLKNNDAQGFGANILLPNLDWYQKAHLFLM